MLYAPWLEVAAERCLSWPAFSLKRQNLWWFERRVISEGQDEKTNEGVSVSAVDNLERGWQKYEPGMRSVWNTLTSYRVCVSAFAAGERPIEHARWE